MQAQQANKQQPVLPPDAQVVKDTSMAETQRKAAKDTQDVQIAQARMKDDQQRAVAEMQAKAQDDQREATLKLQLAAMDNETKIKIENARLTHETIQQALTPQPAEMPPTQGVPNGQ